MRIHGNKNTIFSIQSISAIAGDESTALNFLQWQENFDRYRRKVAVEKFLRSLENISSTDCREKFLAGRISYGDVFSPSFIDHEKEMLEEAIDFQNYSDMQEYCRWKQDPESFEEYISQYLS